MVTSTTNIRMFSDHMDIKYENKYQESIILKEKITIYWERYPLTEVFCLL